MKPGQSLSEQRCGVEPGQSLSEQLVHGSEFVTGISHPSNDPPEKLEFIEFITCGEPGVVA